MALILLLLSLFFGRQFIRVDALPAYCGKACYREYDGNVTTLGARNKFLSTLLQNEVHGRAWVFKFYNVSADDDYSGIPNNKVYVLFQCREDLSIDRCRECVNDAILKLVLECNTYDEGVVWYEECMVRYAYRNFFSLFETLDPKGVTGYHGFTVSNVDDFDKVLAKTMDKIIKEAAKVGHNGSHFGTGEMRLSASSDKVYGLAQCTRDLDSIQCQKCLESALTPGSNNNGVMVFRPSCQLRYEREQFYSSRGNSLSKPGVIVAIASATTFGFVLLASCLWLCLCRTKPKESFEKLSKDGTMEDISSLESLQVDFTVVQTATGNFSEENKLGRGGFGEVYKGKFSNGEEVAVKRLSKNSQQGSLEFKNEVLLLAKLQHRNLVKLQGFCLFGEEKILIYEFLTNSSLDHFLYNQLKRASLDWGLRFKIINGIAKGILYLHEDSRLKIIHRDLKVSNILLDEAMNAKIADFGLAKLFNLDQTQGDTMKIAGTYGYMAPEYALAGQFSVKSDVYSFGVILLEIVSGQRNNFFQSQSDEGLIHRAWRFFKEDVILDLVDPLLDNNFCEEKAKLCIQIGLLCIQENAAHRPRMASVVALLNGQDITLPLPNAPHFYAIGVLTNALSSHYYDSSLGSEVQHSKSDQGTGTHTGTSNTEEICER